MKRRLLVLLATLLVLSCSTMYDGSKGNPCAKSVPLSSSNRPIICVDDRNLSKLTTNPYEIWVRKNAPIKWYTVTGTSRLAIAFVNDECVDKRYVDCPAGSSCDLTVKRVGKEGTKCKYTITLTRGEETKSEDPIIIIDGGMYDPNAPGEKEP